MSMRHPYHFTLPDGYSSDKFSTIEECVESCKNECADRDIDYDDREVKLFMTDSDGVWEVTEVGELAG